MSSSCKFGNELPSAIICGNFLTSCGLVSFSRRSLLLGVSLLLLSRLIIAENYFQLSFQSLTARLTVADSTETVLTSILSKLLCGFQLVSKARVFLTDVNRNYNVDS